MKSILKPVILFFLFSEIYNNAIYCADETSASKIERSQEILEKEKILRERLEKGEKIFIKKIIVVGIASIDKNEMKKMISPFKNRWLSKDEIQGLIYSIKAAYEQSGYSGGLPNISYQINKNTLKIIIIEGEIK